MKGGSEDPFSTLYTGSITAKIGGSIMPIIDTWNSKRLFIRRSVWKGDFQSPKSQKAVRKIDLPDSLIPELMKWKLQCPVSEEDLMFPAAEGKITDHDNARNRHFNSALRRAKLRHVSFHSLRHTNASMRIQAGQNIKYISTQLGHASVKITLDTYGHLFDDQDFNRQQVGLLETVFSASVRNPLEETSPKTEFETDFVSSVRNPLEKSPQNAEKGLAVSANPL